MLLPGPAPAGLDIWIVRSNCFARLKTFYQDIELQQPTESQLSQLLINEYFKQLDIIRKISGSTRETIVREAFKDLLKNWWALADAGYEQYVDTIEFPGRAGVWCKKVNEQQTIQGRLEESSALWMNLRLPECSMC